MKKMVSIIMTAIMLVSLTVPALAAPIKTSGTASTLRLESVDGSAQLKNASGKDVKISNGARLYNGYKLATEKSSYAYVSLDDTKAIKLDASSSSEVSQSGKKLELKVTSGQMFFNVTAPLKSNESLNIRTSTMVTGVRGTSGWISVIDRFTTRLSLLEGQLSITSIDPVTGLQRTTTIVGGQTATIVFHGIGSQITIGNTGTGGAGTSGGSGSSSSSGSAGTSGGGSSGASGGTISGGALANQTIQNLIAGGTIRDEHIVLEGTGLTVESLQEEDVPGFVAMEVKKDKELQKKIEENSPLSVPAIIGDAEARLEKEQAAAEAEDKAIQEKLDKLTADKVDPLFEESAENASGGGASGGGGSSDPTSTYYTLSILFVDQDGNVITEDVAGNAVPMVAPYTVQSGASYDAGTPPTIVGYAAPVVRQNAGDAPAQDTMDSDKTVTFVYELLPSIVLIDPTTEALTRALDAGYGKIEISDANRTPGNLNLGDAILNSSEGILLDYVLLTIRSGEVSIDANDTVIIDGMLVISSPTDAETLTQLTNNGELVGNGTLLVSNDAVLYNEGLIQINSTNSLDILGGHLVNHSDIYIGTDDTPGALTVGTDAVVEGDDIRQSVLDNYGTITIAKGSTATFAATAALSNMSDNQDDGSIFNYGTMTVSGIMSNNSSIRVGDDEREYTGTLALLFPDVSNGVETYLENSGTIIVDRGSTMSIAGNQYLYNSGSITNDGTLSIAAGDGSEESSGGMLINNGTLTVDTNGILSVNGALENAADGTSTFFNIYGSADFNGAVSNYGVLTVQAGGALTVSGGALDNDALGQTVANISILGTLTTLNGSTLNNFGGITVYTAAGSNTPGQLILGGTTFNNTACSITARNSDTYSAGIIRNSGEFTNSGFVESEGILKNTGSFINRNPNFSPAAAQLQNTTDGTNVGTYTDEANLTALYAMVQDDTGLVTAWGPMPTGAQTSSETSPFYDTSSKQEVWLDNHTYTVYGTQAADTPVTLPTCSAANVTLDLNGKTMELSRPIVIGADYYTAGTLTITDTSVDASGLGATGTGAITASSNSTYIVDILNGGLTLNNVTLTHSTRDNEQFPAVIHAYAASIEDPDSSPEGDTVPRLYAATNITATNSTLSCARGYGIEMEYTESSTVSVTDSEITSSSSAIYFEAYLSALTVSGSTLSGNMGIDASGYETEVTVTNGSTVTGTYQGIEGWDVLITVDGDSTVTGDWYGIQFVDSYATLDSSQEALSPPEKGGVVVKNGTVSVVPDADIGYQYGIAYYYTQPGLPTYHVTIGDKVFSADTIVIPPWSEIEDSEGNLYYVYDSLYYAELTDENGDPILDDEGYPLWETQPEISNADGNATVSGDGALTFGVIPN